ncbi:MAG: hypothetical protein V1743_07920 [Nanoarchaeota archaeon]
MLDMLDDIVAGIKGIVKPYKLHIHQTLEGDYVRVELEVTEYFFLPWNMEKRSKYLQFVRSFQREYGGEEKK